ncbi:hypothetical protein AXE76_01785 [Gardnerella vaginalis]|uniref:Uncharacterized protein n=2 Tax=Gardnerella vaginalis TaxID=2702 RepID=A0A3E1IPN8_GARVA|nr:hypothetical protein AXE76_01785 [Gardnerella vaginalis]
MFAMKKNNAFLYYCVSTVVLICMLTTWVVYVRFVADTVQNSGFSLNHVASSAISAITKPHTRSTDDILSKAGKEYKKVLENIHKYSFNDAPEGDYTYALWDINDDKIPDLLVNDTYEVKKNDSDDTQEVSSTRVFSYDGNKLVAPNNVLKTLLNKYEHSTLFFYRNHKGLVFYLPESEEWYNNYSNNSPSFDPDTPFKWKEVSYTLTGNNLNDSTTVVDYPIKKNENDTCEMDKVVAPVFIPINDDTGINKLINSNKRSDKQKAYDKQVLQWQEKGYQVYTGTVKQLTPEEAYNYPGAPVTYTGFSLDDFIRINNNPTTTVLALDNPRSASSYCNGTECGYRPPSNLMNRVVIILDDAFVHDPNHDKIMNYVGKRVTFATDGMYDTVNNLPWSQPVLSSSSYIIQELDPSLDEYK